MKIYDELSRRGLLAQTTDDEAVKDAFNNKQITFYVGFDATADSLHVGHFLQLMIMRRMQKAGHRPIALLGGGTTMVGDPSGRTDMRKMLTKEDIAHNAECFKEQMRRFVDFEDGKAMMLNNADWLLNLNYVDFLREIGVHFSVNKMLSAECFKSRLERGLSFIEFNYMLMQSYDFLRLNTDYGCTFELGGSDQWGNIVAGADLIRRVTGKEAYGVTFTLLTTREGKKMGKTAGGAVWLDRNKTTPYEFFQYWRNVEDGDVINCMLRLTELPYEEIMEYSTLEGEKLNPVKEKLAYELTKLVHGQDDAEKCLAAARSAFSGGLSSDMPGTELNENDSPGGEIAVLDLLIKCSLVSSKGEARRLIEQGGLTINGNKVSDINSVFSLKELNDAVIKKGKKVFHKITVKA